MIQRLLARLRQLLCSHHYAYYQLVPAEGGQLLQVKCDLCGKTCRSESLVED